MPSEKDYTLEFNQYVKSDEMPYIVYADIEYSIEKINECPNNPKNWGAYSSWIFNINNLGIWSRRKYAYYHGKDCMKKFCEPLKKQAKNITDFEKKKVLH